MMISLKRLKRKKVPPMTKKDVTSARVQLEKMTEKSFNKFDDAKRKYILDNKDPPGKDGKMMETYCEGEKRCGSKHVLG